MNCQQCQSRLMSSEKPEFPSFEVDAHLAECLSCREFQRQLVFLESQIGRVPVPPSRTKTRLLEQLLQYPPASPALTRRAGSVSQGRQFGSDSPRSWFAGRWLEVAVGLAAAVVLIVCGLWIGNMLSRSSSTQADSSQQAQIEEPAPLPSPSTGKLQDPLKNNGHKSSYPKGKTLVAKLMDCDLKLAQAQTPRQRVEALAELATLLHRETTDLSQSAGLAELNKLAALYRQVIQDGMLPQARELPMEERREVLPGVTAQLVQVQREAQQTARNTPRSAEALRLIAAAAHDGDAHLRELMSEGLE
jgi:hypothetical protein